MSVLDPTTLTTVVLYPHGTLRAVGTQGALVHTTQGGIRYAAYYDQGGPFEDFTGGEATNSCSTKQHRKERDNLQFGCGLDNDKPAAESFPLQ